MEVIPRRRFFYISEAFQNIIEARSDNNATAFEMRYYGSDVYDAAQAIYNGEAFGVGTEGDGVLLLLSMWDRS